MAEVRLERLEKHFNGQLAVDSLDLTIADREFLTLVGPSGCGKTTTLRMICGLERVSGGQIFFDDQPVAHLPANRRDVAMVFQSYALYPHMTVAENIAFALRNMRRPGSEIEKKVAEVAQLLGIEQLLKRKPRELSGGQRQRVALGRALVRDAEAYLLDEPLSNLDAKLRVQMRAEIKKLHSDLQRTFIYVTHDQVEAMTMSDRIAILNEGRLQQCAAPMEVYKRPANLFVAGFMGNPPMNFLPGELRQEDREPQFVGQALRLTLPRSQAKALEASTNRRVVLGIRPEDIRALARPEPDSHAARVFVEEPMGADVLLTVELGGELLKLRVEAPFSVARDAVLHLRLRPDRLHVFDADSGRVIASPAEREVADVA